MEPKLVLVHPREGEAAPEAEADAGEPGLESPFLPGTNIQWAWDSTSLNYAKTCPQLYKYVIIDGWQTEVESIHLRFGMEIHTSFQEYDLCRAAGIAHNEALLEVIHNLLIRTWGWEPDATTKAGKYKHRKSLVRTVVDYLDNYNLGVQDPAQTYILNNGQPAVELSFRFELDFGPRAAEDTTQQPYVLCGHLDRVVSFNDQLFVMDYKTTTTTPGSYYFDQYGPNNQMTLYTLASQVILGSPVKGVIIDAIQILMDSTRTVRGFTYRTPDQLNEWTEDLSWWLSLAETWAEQNYWPKNDLSCDKYGGCRFRQICSKDPSVRGQFLKSSFVKGEPWNPLKPR